MSKTGWIIFCAFCLVFLVAAIPGFAQEPTTDQPEPKDTPNAKSWMKVDNSESQAVGAEIEEDAVFWGKTVRKIDYNLPKWITKDDIKQFTRNTKIEAGKELARWRVRATMRRIYLLGGIDNIMIRATPVTADEVDVEIKIFPTYLIREIKVQDNKTFNYNEIVSDILHLSVDDDFRESDIPKWKNKLIAALNKEGRLSANVRIGFERTKWRDDNKVDLIINLDENKQYKVSQISLKGDFGQYSRHKILSILNWRTNMKYREEDIVKGLANLKKFLKKNNYLEVTLPEWDLTDNRQVRINHKNREIKLFLELDFGPRVLIEYPGECFTCAQKKWKIPGALGIANQRR